MIPSSLRLHGIILEDRDPINGGGYADIFRALYLGQRVALKRLRTFSAVQKTEKEENVSTSYDPHDLHSNEVEGFPQRGSCFVVSEQPKCATFFGY